MHRNDKKVVLHQMKHKVPMQNKMAYTASFQLFAIEYY